MKRKLVQAGGSLAVTLPVEVVKDFKLKKGVEVEVSVHPQTGAVTIRPGVRSFEGGQVTARDLVALILAIWADKAINHPPRYLSWIIQRWQTLPEAAPVENWDRWRALAELPLAAWFEAGRREWIELASRENRDLPFGLDLLIPEDETEEEERLEVAIPVLEVPVVAASPEPDGLDERPGGGRLTVRNIWSATLGQLSMQLNPAAYTTWVEGTKAVSYVDGVLTVRARHMKARNWLAGQLNPSIEWTASRLAKVPIKIQYIADPPLIFSQDAD